VGAGVRRSVESIEAQVEREFFETVGRDAREVAEEEAAAAGLAAISLADPFDSLGAAQPHVAGGRPILASQGLGIRASQRAMDASESQQQRLAAGQERQQQQQQQEQGPVLVEVVPGCSFLVPANAGPAGLELGLARILATCPPLMELIQGSYVLQLATGPGALAAMTAVRACGARRTLATHAERARLSALASTLAANSPRLVVERLKLAQLVWGDGPSARNVLTLGAAHGGYSVILVTDLGAAVKAEVAAQGCETKALTSSSQGGLQHWQLPVAQPGIVGTAAHQQAPGQGWGLALRTLLEGARLAAVGHVPASLGPTSVQHHNPHSAPDTATSPGQHQGQAKVLITQLSKEHSAEVVAGAQAEGWRLHEGLSLAAQSAAGAHLQGGLVGGGMVPAVFLLDG
jgi:predicted nicotinamide N-methyase